ncbi:PD-(D/E)XK nuclease-like domain-containing protein [Runella salmonicolor]|uniref:PD-(D/E)XK nuclease-like domain-containing protein n=1 Tax=Runella salmonicolor TaxID=2950278 RepID=A0ABT1FVR9_9BACT|nr:PD-(D/E)XK nuclease-like domain-containing protein [Runella salmonicolor]MCP1384868.1 PD-(D/E)XK nuclease-like domain-containing protein [Runella salmonicolor]
MSAEYNDILMAMESAMVSEREINPLSYDPTDYVTIQEVVSHIINRKKTIEVKDLLPQLSVNGTVIQDPMENYLKRPANSASALKQILKTPLHYWCYLHEKIPIQSKKAFEFGTFCHMAFLEPELFDALIVEPNYSLSTTEGVKKSVEFWEKTLKGVMKKSGKRHLLSNAKSAVKRAGLTITKIDGLRRYREELSKRAGKICVGEVDKRKIELVRRHYYTYGGGILPALMKGSANEVSFYGTDEGTGLPVKIRPDGLQLEENIGCNAIISFKTTSAEDIDKFAYDAAKFQYQMAEGMYLEVASQVTGRRFNAVICVMLQNVEPFLPAVFMYSPEDLQNGRYRYQCAIADVKKCIDSKTFPGFDAKAEFGDMGIIQLNLPEWSKRELKPVDIEL